jgi:hypothetical protein
VENQTKVPNLIKKQMQSLELRLQLPIVVLENAHTDFKLRLVLGQLLRLGQQLGVVSVKCVAAAAADAIVVMLLGWVRMHGGITVREQQLIVFGLKGAVR